MSGLRAAVSAAFVAGAVLVPRAAGSPGDEIVLHGDRTAYVDVTIDDSTTLEVESIDTSGAFGGFYAEQVRTRDAALEPHARAGGAVVVRALGPQPQLLGIAQLMPGVVRLYLVADGPTTVRVLQSGNLDAMRLRPTRRTTAAAHSARLAQRDGAWVAAVPVRLAPGSLTVGRLRAAGDLVAAAHARFCFRAPGAACPAETHTRVVHARRAGGGVTDGEYEWAAGPSRDAAAKGGAYVADARLVSDRPVRGGVVVAFTLALAKK